MTPELTTDRLVLSQWEERDAAWYRELVGERGVGRLRASVRAWNTASFRVLAKLGFDRRHSTWDEAKWGGHRSGPPASSLLGQREQSAIRGTGRHMVAAGRYDYVIVGGGTAGSVLAARLSQDPLVRVVLLEAGASDGPAIMSSPSPAAAISLQGSAVNWAYSTTPQAGTDGAVHRWPRGRVLGGSSSINAMMHVRGHRSGYDARAAQGATGWDYDSLLPFLQRSEQTHGRDPLVRGTAGPMRIEAEPPLPGPGRRDDEACRAYIRSTAATYFHPVGTCAVGTGELAVVDPLLRVRGVDGLRVAHASVMPSLVSAPVNATVLAIAERAASLLAGAA
jgi:choline dehydrogenase-like flavoprotein